MSEPAKDLLKGLLSRSASQRLGTIRNGVSDLRSHPFFASVDWDTLATRTPPIIPAVDGKGDTKYFKIDDVDDDGERCGADVLNSSSSSSEESAECVASDGDIDGLFEGF